MDSVGQSRFPNLTFIMAGRAAGRKGQYRPKPATGPVMEGLTVESIKYSQSVEGLRWLEEIRSEGTFSGLLQTFYTFSWYLCPQID